MELYLHSRKVLIVWRLNNHTGTDSCTCTESAKVFLELGYCQGSCGSLPSRSSAFDSRPFHVRLWWTEWRRERSLWRLRLLLVSDIPSPTCPRRYRILSVDSFHTVRHPRCVFIHYNWINQLSNTTVWWLDICCLLHRYQLHVSTLMAIFRLID